MICDMGGFAAACYQRGIRFCHLPTTVLAMTDAAIGGKLGIDFEGFKNYIGLIRPPSFIWIDQSFLDTLPRIEKNSGLAEIVKHGIIGSRSLWELVSGVDHIENMPWGEIFNLSIPVKVNIVEKDLTEQGLRKVLNFGHTIGHGIESYYLAKGQPVTHGQCVALGMMAESKISSSLGLLKTPDFEAIIDVIICLLNIVPLPDVEDVIPWMMKDKKRSGGKVGFSLPDGIGSCRWDVPVDIEKVRESFDWLHAQVNSVPFRLSVEK
jgi:3-dehydroquinate synthase